jgi:hypothetical protein
MTNSNQLRLALSHQWPARHNLGPPRQQTVGILKGGEQVLWYSDPRKREIFIFAGSP